MKTQRMFPKAVEAPVASPAYDREDIQCDMETLIVVLNGVVSDVMNWQIIGNPLETDLHRAGCDLIVLRTFAEAMKDKMQPDIDRTFGR